MLKKIVKLGVITTLFYSSTLLADSPLTSTEFWKAYKDNSIVTKYKDKIYFEDQLPYLTDENKPLDIKLAIINHFSFSLKEKGILPGLYLDYLQNKKGSSFEFERDANAEELIVFAYILGMDSYLKIESDAIKYAEMAIQKDKRNSYTVRLISSLLKAQQAMDVGMHNWCEVYSIPNSVHQNNNLTMDIKKEADDIVFKYIDLYRPYCTPMNEAIKYFKSKQYDKSFGIFLEEAKKNNPKAQNHLALQYENGAGVKKDLNQAIYWYVKSAENGNNHAVENLIVALYNNSRYDEAFKYATKYSNKFFHRGYSILGSLYIKGLGTAKNYKEALKWFKKAADEKEFAHLNHFLWKMFEADSYPENIYEFLLLLEKSNDPGHLDTAANIYKAQGDKQKAIELYKNRIIPAIYKANNANEIKEYKQYFKDIKK